MRRYGRSQPFDLIMTTFATLRPNDRRELLESFEKTSSVSAVVVEKDFWVVWLLSRIYCTDKLGKNAVFKGGTSLAKVFNAINRFSEDIDLGIDPVSLGWDEQELMNSSRNKWEKKQRKLLENACAKEVESSWRPRLEEAVVALLGEKPEGGNWLCYKQTGRQPPVIFFEYPKAIPSTLRYITKSVKLEFGSLADQRPKMEYVITAMVDKLKPGSITDVKAKVVALEFERTFWEKATILHSEYHRPCGTPQPLRHARHYSDFAALWQHERGKAAATQIDLLHQVREHKMKFFASRWAHYGTARPGSLQLVPPKKRLEELRRDYAAMHSMFIDEPISFDKVLEALEKAENYINGKSVST